ncbi:MULTISPECIES: cysteine desulfurase family protein [Pseudomonas]|uniref:cysteine desulfurase n=1 Tax=Pseudomonas putida NBRC 14164 TaxID=1211579 RepID=A0ABN5UJU1_PSEPU|nr:MULTISPECIES: aminotransferase class V-fold PLP-dependent enzyme [Pseudomonas]EKT4462465.1 aminotransferase class V-fold PLP-dependent enzyme [Pseudomonas putida]EKT4556496.1 aminotransferase class V-fold PLP-dependent enzyme [Pseudomonas putida]MCX9139432.1 aminotransferase class V-fold PLP-dependent enzyme [Pseudomonas sp. DCB_PUT]MDD1973800.1 aminotransferase class V-fold PLP-dependent enzyme [Pseudomonas putida]MDO1465541.1 aminotransferase class V-fold PLP-dependent enzyme [Pseudomonas
MPSAPLYFDYAATTPVDDRVIETMLACLGSEANFGNPASSGHAYGQAARQAVEQARQQVAERVGAQADNLVWTSGATESNNLALKGIAQGFDQPGHLITSQLEHKAVLDTVAELERQGWAVTRLTPDAAGLIQPASVQAALRADTRLVSLMAVNNELGTVTDFAAIGQQVRAHGALLHVDAAQAVGKLAIDLNAMAVDLMSLSAHKVYGPKGIGALYVGPRARTLMRAQMHGGGHEQGLRSGTLATHQIAGMGSAFALAGQPGDSEHQRLEQLATRLRDGLLVLPGVTLNGSASQRIPHTLNLCIDSKGFNSAALASELALSTTSACNSASNAASYVLLALGLDERQARNSVRLSIGRFTTEAQVDQALAVFDRVLTRASAALW